MVVVVDLTRLVVVVVQVQVEGEEELGSIRMASRSDLSCVCTLELLYVQVLFSRYFSCGFFLENIFTPFSFLQRYKCGDLYSSWVSSTKELNFCYFFEL